MDFPVQVQKEIERCRDKYRAMQSWHHLYGLLWEEVEELWEEIRKKPSKRDGTNMLRELVQIAALCQLAAEELLP